ncbi:MAG: ATP-binding protein [Candidatus Hodarchaeota archaeon]
MEKKEKIFKDFEKALEDERERGIKIERDFMNFGKKMTLIFKSISDIYLLVSEDGIIHECNFKDMAIEQEDRDLKGQKLEKLLTREVSEAILEIFPELKESNKSQTLQFNITFKGERRDFEAEVFSFLENKYVILLQDITDIFRTTEMMFETEESLRQSEENFKNISEQSLMGISIYQDKQVKYINKVGAEILGQSREDIMSGSLKEYGVLIEPDDFEKMAYEFGRMEDDQTADSSLMLVFKLKTKDQKTLFIEQYTNPIMFQGKRAVLNVYHNITEKMKAQEILKNEYKAMKEIDEMRKNFISSATHELKTPLVSTCGATRFILDNLKDRLDPETLELVEIIARGANRLKKLIENLLDFSKIGVGKFELELENADLVQAVKNAVKETRYQQMLRGHALILNAPDNLIVKMDIIRIEQLISNLLSNAIKNTPHGGNITVEIMESSIGAKVSVMDNGVGLTDGERENLFEKFGKIAREDTNLDVDIQGSGLGLYISKNIAELHGGTLIAESEGRNKGSKFIFTLPIKK